MASCYGITAQLVYGDVLIESTRGFHQGDPLATLLFSLVLHPLIVKIQEEVPDLQTNGWFLDDGLLAGDKEEITKATTIILEEGPPRGLMLSTEISDECRIEVSDTEPSCLIACLAELRA